MTSGYTKLQPFCDNRPSEATNHSCDGDKNETNRKYHQNHGKRCTVVNSGIRSSLCSSIKQNLLTQNLLRKDNCKCGSLGNVLEHLSGATSKGPNKNTERWLATRFSSRYETNTCLYILQENYATKRTKSDWFALVYASFLFLVTSFGEPLPHDLETPRKVKSCRCRQFCTLFFIPVENWRPSSCLCGWNIACFCNSLPPLILTCELGNRVEQVAVNTWGWL